MCRTFANSAMMRAKGKALMNTEDLFNTSETLCAEHGKLEAIIEAGSNAIFEIDNKSTLVFANPAFCLFFQIASDRYRYCKILDLFDSSSVNKVISDIFSGKKQLHFENLEISVNGLKNKFIELKLIGVPVLEKIFTVGIILDKTDVIRAIKNREYYIEKLHQIINELKLDSRDMIYNLASLVEINDYSTGKHLERIEQYTLILAAEYYNAFKGRDPHLTERYVEDLAISSVLHDIGKVGVSDTILTKPGKLSREEFEIIKQHTVIVGEALKGSKGKMDFLALGREIGYAHHEKWDGTGYPEGLSGSDIPLSARIVSVCDVYDALITERPYKHALSHQEAIDIIHFERGKGFDPEIVDNFSRTHYKFNKVSENMRINGFSKDEAAILIATRERMSQGKALRAAI